LDNEEERKMEIQAFEHYEEGLKAEEHGQYEEAYDEFLLAVLKDSNNKDYIDAFERVTRFHRRPKR
jgi:hypothetical protein